MRINKGFFGEIGQEKGVYLYTLSNDKGTEVKITNFGGIVISIKTVNKNGKIEDLTLGFDNFEQYEAGHPYFGVICGRFANRIANAEFTLEGEKYKLVPNDRGNTLHGGNKGFDKVIWKSGTIENEKEVGVKLVYLSPDLEEGFPGNLTVEVTYLLNNSNELTILYSAVTDKTTVVNLTSHIYFNLNGCKKEIYDQVLTINSQKATEINSVLIPTGKIENILGSALDYHKPVRIGDKITKIESGYDHNYILSKQNPGELTFAASVHDAGSGRIMEMFTTEPAVQLYSANHFDGTLTGKYGIAYKKHFALCLEAQHYPDSPNHPEFPSTILKPGETYSQKTIYKFGIE
jgi:aldose 1-epimerase